MKVAETIPKMLKEIAQEWGETPAQISLNRKTGVETTVTYRELLEIAKDVAAALTTLGVSRGDKIGLVSDNRAEWQQFDLGLLMLGAIDVPRGSDATRGDLSIILGTTECSLVAVENASQANKIFDIIEGKESVEIEKRKQNPLSSIKTLILWEESEKALVRAKPLGIKILSFCDLLTLGKEERLKSPGRIDCELEKGESSDTACIIFTSGTTGTPKGVVLTHKNFLAQLDELPERIILNPGDKTINVLPVWHVFERACEYVIFVQAATICYSKPIGPILLSDFLHFNPVLIPAVPRIFESIYDGVMKKLRAGPHLLLSTFNFFVHVSILHTRMTRKMLNRNTSLKRYHPVFWWVIFFIPWIILWPLRWMGGVLAFHKIKVMLGKNFRYGVVGGGAYPRYIDEFFWAIGIKIVEGYGLTETAPVISVRPVSRPVFGNVGSPIRRVKARVVSLEDGFILPRGKFGAIQISGDTVMKGYYKNDELTKKVLKDGWLDTGDLGYLSIHDELVIKGRKKDTIVLRGGENVEPAPIEMQLTKSRYIKAAIIVGQDERFLGALILVDNAEVKNFGKEFGLQYASYEELLSSSEVHNLFEGEIASLINPKNGFKLYERINKFALLTKDFEVGQELSAKQEVMRYRITQIYKTQIAEIFS